MKMCICGHRYKTHRGEPGKRGDFGCSSKTSHRWYDRDGGPCPCDEYNVG